MREIHCDFAIMGSPFASLDFSYGPDDGLLSEYAKITHYGRTTQETLSAEARDPGVLVHAILSKESAENWVRLFIYSDLNGKLVNHRMPAGFQEIQGSCAHR